MTDQPKTERAFGTAIFALILCAGSFWAGRVTAPVHTRTLYRAAPLAVPQAAPLESPGVPTDPAAAPVSAALAPDPAAQAGVQVWVNTRTRVYHMPGSRWYGATRDGRYMGEADAIAAGYRRSERG